MAHAEKKLKKNKKIRKIVRIIKRSGDHAAKGLDSCIYQMKKKICREEVEVTTQATTKMHKTKFQNKIINILLFYMFSFINGIIIIILKTHIIFFVYFHIYNNNIIINIIQLFNYFMIIIIIIIL